MPRQLAGFLLAIALAFLQPHTLAQRPASSASYLDIVAQYRAGAFENAIKALASDPDAHVPDYVARQLERAHGPVTATHADLLAIAKRMASSEMSPVLPAAAVLHLETGHALLLQKPDDDRGVGHLTAARDIVDSEWWKTVPEMLPDRAAHYDEVRRDIYRGITFVLQQHRQFGPLQLHLDHAREQFPKDAEVPLALGTLDELRATAIMLRDIEPPVKQNPSASWRRRQRQEYLDKAARRFRDALAIDAGLVEARVRLGRVLQERGKLPEARRELEAALAATAATAATAAAAGASASAGAGVGVGVGQSPAAIHYDASLFLGEVLEAQGDAAGAVARYRETVTRWPGCQSAHLALSRALEATGDRRAARDALQPLWRAEADRKCVDPWWSYGDGQSWRLRAVIDALRGRVKDKS